MDIDEIKASLSEPDFQYRLKAIAALKDYTPEVAMPLLMNHLHDAEFLVRTFVAMGLGKQQTSESFAALLELMKFDNTPSVRAEAANSLSLFGRVAASHLLMSFVQDDHWLVRQSILAALVDLECHSELLEVYVIALAEADPTVQLAAVDALGALAESPQQEPALAHLLVLADSDSEQLRMHAATALKHFSQPAAKAALEQLRQDPHHQVVAAALENLV